jgi:hypothetical protein
MQTGRLILLLVLVLVVIVVVVLLLRRSGARKEQQRVEAALLRTDADQIAARLAGQTTFAQQAAERAEVARVEAEERAREAARLEEEAAEQRAAAEASRREYEQTMRRADDVDPDVSRSSFAPVDEAEPTEGGTASDSAPATASDSAPATASYSASARASDTTPATASGAVPAATAATAAGAALWGTGDGDRHPDSERIASAADYRDDEPAAGRDDEPAAGRDDEVSTGEPVGRASGMSDDARPDREDLGTEREGEAPATSMDSDVSHDVESPRGEWGGPRQDDVVGRGHDDGAELAVIAEPEAYAATEPLSAEDQAPPVEREPLTDEERQRMAPAGADRGADAGADAGADGGADADAERGGDAGADGGADAGADADAERGGDGAGDVRIIADPDQYASTEPLSATEGGAPTDDAALAADRGAEGDRPLAADDRSWDTGDTASSGRGDLADPDAHAPAETGAAVAENDESTWTAADDAERATTTGGSAAAAAAPARDWAADEGELLEQTHDRGDRLAEERQDLARDAGTSTSEGVAERAARRISDFHELRDGGYGVGSAAPLDDGAQPMDHPIQGRRDSMSFHVPGDPGYDTAEPDVWFYDETAAERAGFRRSGR